MHSPPATTIPMASPRMMPCPSLLVRGQAIEATAPTKSTDSTTIASHGAVPTVSPKPVASTTTMLSPTHRTNPMTTPRRTSHQ